MLKNSYTKYFVLFVISIVIYFFHAAVTRQGLYGDGNGYYSYTNTLYFQKNLDFSQIYNHLENFTGTSSTFSRVFWDRNHNPFLIGTGIIWLPSMFFISALSKILNLGIGRFDLIYELGPGITGIILMISGLIFLEKYLLNFYTKSVSFWTIISLFFASNIFYYTALEPALSHQPSFFIISFLLWWTYRFKKTLLNIFILGGLTGLLGMVRIADIILLIPVFYQAKLTARDYFVLLIGGLVLFSPQLTNQYYMYGTVLTHPYLTGASGTWQISFIHFWEYLTSPKRGLFLWTPLFLIGMYGLFKSKSRLFIPTVALLWLITSSWSAYLSAGFGQRFSFAAIPLFAYGLAYIYKKMAVKNILVILTLCFIWNMLLIKNVYMHKDLFIQSPDFTYKQFLQHMIQFN